MTAGLPVSADRVALLRHVRGVAQGVGFRSISYGQAAVAAALLARAS